MCSILTTVSLFLSATSVVLGQPRLPVKLLDLIGGYSSSQVTALNSRGVAVGSVFTPNSQTAVVWDGNTPTILPPFSGGSYSQALAINDAGEIAGISSIGPLPFIVQACLWKNGQPNSLELLAGGTSSRANGINNRGQIAGTANNASNRQRAVLWENGRINDLGTLPGGSFSYAAAINDRGQIVGLGDDATGATRALL